MGGCILAALFALVNHPGSADDEPEDDDVAADECGDGTTDGGNEATHSGLSAAAATAAAFPALGSGTGAAAAFAAAAATDVTVFDGSMPAFTRRFFDSCCSFSFFHSLYFFLVLSPIYLAPSTPLFPRYAVPAAPLFMRCTVAFLVLGAIYFTAFLSPHHTGNTLLRSSLSFLFCFSVSDSV